jgi:hypothetical protein
MCIISVNLSGVYDGPAAFQFSFQGVTFIPCPAGDHNLLENIAVLTAFVNGYAGDTAAANDQCFSHKSPPLPGIRIYDPLCSARTDFLVSFYQIAQLIC